MPRKFKNKSLPRGILIDRGIIYVRIFPNGRMFLKAIGPVSDPTVMGDAITKLNQFREQIRLGKFQIEERVDRLTLSDAVEIYWNLHGSKLKSCRSVSGYINALRKSMGNLYVDEITYLDVRNHRIAREKQVKPSTVNHEHACLTTVINKLREWQRLGVIRKVRLPAQNPGSLVRKVDEKQFARKRMLTPEEFPRLMDASPMEVRRIILGAIHTVLRRKDLINLTRDNVNETTNQLEGIQAKTGRPYVIPINGVVRELIETATGRHIFDFRGFRKKFASACRTARLQDFQFRDLRRTGARTMLMKGLDLATVSAFLGHTSLQMTQAYVSATHEQKRIGGEILGTVYRWEGSKAQFTAESKLSVKLSVNKKFPERRSAEKVLK